MTDQEIAAVVCALVEAEFGLPAGAVTLETEPSDVDGWDSMRQATILILIERRFGFQFRGVDVADLETVGDLVGAVQARLGR